MGLLDRNEASSGHWLQRERSEVRRADRRRNRHAAKIAIRVEAYDDASMKARGTQGWQTW
jgi:hypothetical protein